MKTHSSLFIAFYLFLLSASAQSTNKLWYSSPARYFEEALVLGNGSMGAVLYGGTETETIALNEITLWSGEPVDPRMNPEAHRYVPLIRQALADEAYARADSLNRFLQGSYSQSYAPMGTLTITFQHGLDTTTYRRELDLNRATATVSYEVQGVSYQRECFVSHPDRVMAIKLSASRQQRLSCTLSFESLLRYTTQQKGSSWEIHGYAPYHAEPQYRTDIADPVRFDRERGTRFAVAIGVKQQGGEVSYSDAGITIKGCDEVEIYLTAATSFNGFDKDPAQEGLDCQQIAAENLRRARQSSYTQLKERHLADYQSLFNRLTLTLGQTPVPDLPTDQRLRRYSMGAEDQNLEALYFQYGRYLLISSSRTPNVPANLQGLWNTMLRPPWSSNYTLNINTEENYWLAEVGNLAELHEPLLGFINNLSKTGKTTAKTFYGCSGWCACHNSDIWAMSNPVGAFGEGDPSWANWNMSGVWLSTHLWEHFLFNRDTAFLRERAYPLMQGAAQFCLDWLVRNEEGFLITAPSTSPENLYKTPEGYVGATLSGATCDMAMIRELFENILQAAATLHHHDDFTEEVARALKELRPYTIGADGSLQEWYEEAWEDYDPQHRHQTHLFGLYPGHHITPRKTPQLAAACEKALEIKGDQTTGWSKGWRINLWARLHDGARAYKMYRELLSYVPPRGGHQGGGTYPNLLDAHPPFQIDGNFGGAAAVLEMLIQSTADRIHLLPALPPTWETGTLTGVCTRCGVEVDMAWEKGKVSKLAMYAQRDGSIKCILNNKEVEVILHKGKKINLPTNLEIPLNKRSNRKRHP